MVRARAGSAGVRAGSVRQLGGEVLGVGRGAAVAERQDPSPTRETLDEQRSGLGDALAGGGGQRALGVGAGLERGANTRRQRGEVEVGAHPGPPARLKSS